MRRFTCCLLVALIGACSSSDGDGDGYAADVDCDDTSAAIHPGAEERCNLVDDNCDGTVDNDPIDGAMWLADNDGDGFGGTYRACEMPADVVTVSTGGDCRDDVADAYPGSRVTEVPGDGIDTDCDGNDVCTDLNCDGLPDIAMPSHHDGDYAITQGARLLSTGDRFEMDPTPTAMNGSLGAAVADFNKDGYPDIVHASYAQMDGAVVNVNTTSFVYWGPTHAMGTRSALPTRGAHWTCTGDFDDNGYVDIVFANNNDGTTELTDSYIYWNRGGAFSPTDRTALPTQGAVYCAVDDLDGDGTLDIVFADWAAAGSFALDSYIYWGNASHTYGVDHRLALPTIGTRSLTIADLNGDGRKELVFWAHHNGSVYTTSNNFIYWNRPGGFAPTDRTELAGMGPYRGAVSDLNDDGHPDIIIPGYYADAANGWATPGTSYIYWGNATSTYSPTNRASLTVFGPLDVVVDDIDMDGHKDLLFPSHYDGDSAGTTVIFYGSATGTFSAANRVELTSHEPVFGTAVADFNHDGFKDVFLPGYFFNASTPSTPDPTPWNNAAYSRIYWGSASGIKPSLYDQFMTRGAWDAVVVGK